MTVALAPLPVNPIPALPLQVTWAPTLVPAVCTPTGIPLNAFGLFGGGQFDLPLIPRVGDPLELLGKGFQNLGLQTSPLAPTLTVLKAAASLVNFVTNLPGNIAAAIAFNPVPLADSVAAVVGAGSDLVALSILPLQLCKMVRGALTLLIQYLQTLKAQIVTLIARFTNVNAMIARAQALGNALMLANSQCAKNRLLAKCTALDAFLASLGVALALISTLLCLITGGELSLTIPPIDGNSLVATIFDPLIAAVTVVRDAIPDLSGFALAC
jgi:hypothetical protein